LSNFQLKKSNFIIYLLLLLSNIINTTNIYRIIKYLLFIFYLFIYLCNNFKIIFNKILTFEKKKDFFFLLVYLFTNFPNETLRNNLFQIEN